MITYSKLDPPCPDCLALNAKHRACAACHARHDARIAVLLRENLVCSVCFAHTDCGQLCCYCLDGTLATYSRVRRRKWPQDRTSYTNELADLASSLLKKLGHDKLQALVAPFRCRKPMKVVDGEALLSALRAADASAPT